MDMLKLYIFNVKAQANGTGSKLHICHKKNRKNVERQGLPEA